MSSSSILQLMANGLIFKEKLESYIKKGWIPTKVEESLKTFYDTYCSTLLLHHFEVEDYTPIFLTFLDLIKEQTLNPFSFPPYHQSVREPFDYYAFGVNFFIPLVDQEKSTIQGHENIQEACKLLKEGANIVFLSNHQTEADPQALSVLLDNAYPGLASHMIFVAGERVTTDIIAVPFSKGRNLLCIYSKRYIDNPPELKHEKQIHNTRTMSMMGELFKKGGKCIYVAPSGGRDRANAQGVVEVAPFDPKNVEMFYLMAKKSKRPTFFYPMSLATYDLLPPPETIQVELGEKRSAKRGAIHLYIGKQLNLDLFARQSSSDKSLHRKERSDFVFQKVKENYEKLKKLLLK